MEEKPILASRETFKLWRGVRRFTPLTIPGVGLVCLQSAMAREWIRIDSASQRARLAAMQGRIKDQEQATREFALLCFGLLVLKANEQGQPLDGSAVFDIDSEEDRRFIFEMDSAITDYVVAACTTNCGIQAIDLEAAQKKLRETIGSSLPTGSPIGATGTT